MSTIKIELSEDEARTVSRMLFKAKSDMARSFAGASEGYAEAMCAHFGTSPAQELDGATAVENRIDAALADAGLRGATQPVDLQ